MRKQFIIKKTLLMFLHWVIPSERTLTRWKKCLGGWRLFWGTSYSKGINLLLSQKTPSAPTPFPLQFPSSCNFHHHHHQQQQQKSTFRKWVWSEQCRNLLQRMEGVPTKTKKRRRKNLPLSLWFADAEATANQMGMCVCFFRNPDAWERGRFLWWIINNI